MTPEIVALVSTLIGAGFGVSAATAVMLTKANAPTSRTNTEKQRADREQTRADKMEENLAAAEKWIAEANGKSDLDRAAMTELRVSLAGLEGRAAAQALTIETTKGELITARADLVNLGEKLAYSEGARQEASKRAHDAERERDEAWRKAERLVADLSTSQNALKITTEDLQAAQCLLRVLSTLYVMAENSLRYQTGEHAYDEKMSERRLARIKLLEAHILYLHEKLKAAESRADQKEVMKSLLDLAKIILSGGGLPPVPGKI